ncbi:MAG: T9SS C-terminal target domain-containing protein [Cryomorphaceae bacterium]|nr:MAG: T9SS C-terminal target domain-containing protein [Cryomorphaceae bacterium]
MCDGTFTAGTINANTTSACVGANITLVLPNANNVGGLSFQWQTSTDNVDWNNAIGAPNADNWSFTFSEALWYRVETTCTEPGGGVDVSDPVFIDANPFFSCYCTDGVGPTSPTFGQKYAVRLPGTGIGIDNTLSPPCPAQTQPNGVYDFTSQSANLVPGQSYTLEVDMGQCGTISAFSNSIKAWIDWNQDGVFDPSTEEIGFDGPISTPGEPNTVLGTITFTVPVTATSGLTGLRVMQQETTNPALMTPCGSITWGSVHDYAVNIIELTCDLPEATAEVIEDCGASQFTIEVDLTFIGGASQVNIIPSTGSPIAATTEDLYVLGPYPSGSSVSVIVENEDDDLCTISLGSFGDCCSSTALTIDNTLPTGNGNFASFTEAINFLNAGSDCGPTAYTFTVTSGQVFAETPPALTRSGDEFNPIIFQTDGNGPNPVITPTGTTAANDAGIVIRGANWITFDGIDIDGNAAGNVEFGYLIGNASATQGASNNTIRNASITLDRAVTNSRGVYVSTSTLQGSGFTPSAIEGTNNNNLLENLTIENSYYGIYVQSGSTLWPGTGNNVIGCTIGADYVGTSNSDIGGGTLFAVGIYFNIQDDFEIANNVVRNIGSSGINRGIYTLNARGNCDIHANQIYGIRNTGATSTSGQRGMDLGTATTLTTEMRVYNNMISDITAAHTGTATALRVLQGIYIANGGATRTYEIDFNSVNIDGSGSLNVSSACFETISVLPVIRVRSNSFVNATGAQTGVAKHFAVRTSSANSIGAAGSVWNWNNYFLATTSAGNGFIGQTATTDRATLQNWSDAITAYPGTDANSLGFPLQGSDPFYVDPQKDLHGTAPALVGAAIPGGLSWVPVDIDGETRLDPSTIGADEYIPASCFPPGGVVLSNIGSNSVDISWNDNGSLSYNWEVRSSGEAGSGPTGLEASGNTTGTTATATGIPAQSSLVVHVQSVCDDGPPEELSNWTGASAFQTLCEPVLAPFFEDFEGLSGDQTQVFPICWDNLGANAWFWRQSQSLIFPRPDYDLWPTLAQTDHTTGTGSYIWMDGSAPAPPIDDGVNVANNEVITPQIDISGLTQPYVNMFVAKYRVTTPEAQNELKLYVWDGSGWLLIGTYDDLLNDDWTEFGALIPSSVPSVTQFRLVAWNIFGSAFYDDILVDDFSVDEAPACPTPSNLTLVDLGSTFAQVSWDCPGCTGQYYIEYGAPGFTPGTDENAGTGTVIGPIVGTSTTIAGLDPDTQYAVRVRQDCDLDGFSNNSGALGFFTGYCQGGPTSTADSNTLGVDLNGETQSISWPGSGSACPGATGVLNNSALVADVFPTIDYTLEVLVGTCSGTWTNVMQVWVDWNDNLEFEPTEVIGTFGPESVGTAGTLATINFTVPVDATPGPKRMRIMQQETSILPLNPCASFGFGSMHDYTLEVLSLDCDCPQPEFIVTDVDQDAITIDVDYNGPCEFDLNDYSTFDLEWSFGGSASGVTMPYTLTGLTPGTLYIIDGIATCTNDSISEPSSVLGTTTNCPAEDLCSYELTLTNTSGNGFDDALVRVSNGWSTIDYTLTENQSTNTWTVLACPGNSIQLELINDVPLSSNMQISLVNADDVQVFGVNGPSPGVLYFQAEGCPDCSAVSNVSVTRAAADLVEASWTNIELAANVTDIDVIVSFFDFFTFDDVIIGQVTVPAGSTFASVPLDSSYPFEEVTVSILTNCTNDGVGENQAIVFLPGCDAADQCEYVFDMTAADNGWGDSGLDVLLDGVVNVLVSLPSGTSGSQTAYACPDGTIDITALNETGGICDITVTMSSASWGDGTTWTLTDNDGATVLSGGPYGNGYSDTQTLTDADNGPYTLTIVSTFSDNSPNYEVEIDGNVVFSGTGTASSTTVVGPIECGGGSGGACDDLTFSMTLNPNTDNALLIPTTDFCGFENLDLVYSATTCPSCFAPLATSVSNVTNNSVDVSWDSNNGAGATYTVYVGLPGFTPGVDEVSSETGIVAASNPQGPVTVGGLTGFTQYEAVVVEDCAGDPSDPGNAVLFTTFIDNDDCADVTPVPYTSPATLVLNGSSIGANDNSFNQSYGAGQAWEAIELTQCASNVQISLCGSVPAPGTGFTGISTGCPATFPGNYLVADNFNFTSCPDGNITLFYDQLLAGTYWIPIFEGSVYTLTITSSECSGCTDPEAINFDPVATLDDGSCIIPDCDFPTLTTTVINDCLNGTFTVDLEIGTDGDATDYDVIVGSASSEPGCFTTVNFGTINVSDNGTPVSTFGVWAGERSTVNVTGAGTYEFTSTIASDFLTVTDLSNNYIAAGTQPITAFLTTGSYYLHVHTNSSCGTAQVGRTLTAQWLSANPPLVNVGTFDGGDIVNLGPFNIGQSAQITVEHNDDATCNQTLNVSSNAICGCIDPQAVNFDPAATEDDGSCILPACTEPPVQFTYCYGDNENTLFYLAPTSAGAEVIISFIQGTIQGSFSDQFVIYDGIDDSAPILYNNPTTVVELDGLIIESTLGNGLLISITSNAFTSCQSTTTYNPINANVYCATVEVPGCTDINAVNFNPAATQNDGSCVLPSCSTPPEEFTYCYGNNENNSWYFAPDTPGEDIILFALQGTVESTTWDNLTIYDGDNAGAPMLYTNPGLTIQLDGLIVESTLGNGLFITFTSDGSVSCQTTGTYNPWIFEIYCGFLVIPGCTDPAAVNFDPDATFDDGTCVLPPPNDDCVAAQTLTPVQWPATQNVLGTLTGASTNGSTACVGTNGADVFYTFNVPLENHYWVNLNPFSGFAGVVEVLDACDGTVVACEFAANSAPFCNQSQPTPGFSSDPNCEAVICANDPFCCNTSWDGACASATTFQPACEGCQSTAPAGSGPVSIFLENLEAGDYVVRIRDYYGNAYLTPASFLVNVQYFPIAQVQDNPNNPLFACNQGGFQLEDIIGASPQTMTALSILDYEWLTSEVDGTGSTLYQRGQPNYSTFIWWLGMEYGKTYNVHVRVLIDLPGIGPTWGVFQVIGSDVNAPGASVCTVSTSPNITLTEVRPQYTPTNSQGNFYALCDIVIAFSVAESQDYRWLFDDGTGSPIEYQRNANNPGVRLSWVDGLVPGTTYQVSVEVQVNGVWSGYGNALPVSLALPPNNVAVRPQYCGVTYAPNGTLLAQSVCAADFYEWEFVNLTTGVTSTAQRPNPGINLNWNQISPLLTAGDYEARVRVQQGGILGDFGPICNFTISGPGAPTDEIPAVRTLADQNSMLYPNPNMGTEVRLELSGLGDENHEVMIQIYDINGQLIQNEGFGHVGDSVSRLIHFSKNLATGMYMVHVVVDGERFATERLIVL